MDTTNPADGNNRRKALLQMLMQKAGAGGLGQGGAASSTPFGGFRATPKARNASGQSFTHPSQVAAAFVGGLGVGSRPGSDQSGSNGSPVQRFLPSDGGPVQRHTAAPASPQAPSAPQAPASPQAPTATPSAPPADGAWADPSAAPSAPAVGTTPDGYTLYQGANNPTPTVDPGFDMYQPGSTPTSGTSNFIPLGNGAYFDPATGQVHYPNSFSAS